MVVKPNVDFYRDRVRYAGLVADMVVHIRGLKITCYVEVNCGLGGNIFISLDNGAFGG